MLQGNPLVGSQDLGRLGKQARRGLTCWALGLGFQGFVKAPAALAAYSLGLRVECLALGFRVQDNVSV